MSNPKNTRKILIVEDDKDLLEIMFTRLVSSGFQVLKAEDGRKGLNAILLEHPDLVLLDIMLPEMNGFEVLESIRGNGDKEIADTKVIILSNLWSDKDILKAKALRIEEYFVKANTELSDVVKRIEEVLK